MRNIEADIKNRLLAVASQNDEEQAAAQDGENERKAGEAGNPPPNFSQKMTGKVRFVPADRDESVIAWLGKVAGAEREKSIFKRGEAKLLTVPKPGGR